MGACWGGRGRLEAGTLAGAPTPADARVGAHDLGGGSHGEAAAIQVQAVGSIGHATQPGKLIVYLLHLALHLS